MWLNFLHDPVFLAAIAVFIFVITSFYWVGQKEKALEDRIKKLEEKQASNNIEKEGTD